MSEQQDEPKPDLQRDFYTVIAHTSEPRVLLLPGESGWTLPHFEPPAAYWSDGARTNKAMREQLGMEVTLLRTLYFWIDREVDKRVIMLNLVENHSPEWTPPHGALWASREELADLTLALEWQREYLDTWLQEDATGEIPPLRVPWARRGWLARVQEWAEDELAARGIMPTARWEQVKHWGISSVWKIPTSEGDIYFKAVPPLFATEPVITQALAARYPQVIPAPLAIHRERSWMLMRDFAAPVMWDANPTAEHYADVLRLLARVQRESVNVEEDLIAEGCVDRRLRLLAAEVDSLLDDPQVALGLSDDEAVRLLTLGSRLKEMCAQLAAYRVPETLVHGDYHAGNIAVKEGRYLVYDWTDACITHPFLDLGPILEESLEESALQKSYDDLRDIYLEMWSDYEPLDRLREAYVLSRVLSALHQLVSYRNIIAGLEPAAKWEMQTGLNAWSRKLLAITS